MTLKTIQFSCPQCGEKTFKFSAEQHAVSNMDGAICSGCAHVLTKDEIRIRLSEMVSTDSDIREKLIEKAKSQFKSTLSGINRNVFQKGRKLP
ncbi:ECs_2282 family putative zinc-binding protein [Xylella fastidiosa]|uniref:ECs_2282 family putative zinc-binding protein n=1 Tax=Xylella fastidiosa TaxID=2371 RepID=UPI003CCEEF18